LPIFGFRGGFDLAESPEVLIQSVSPEFTEVDQVQERCLLFGVSYLLEEVYVHHVAVDEYLTDSRCLASLKARHPAVLHSVQLSLGKKEGLLNLGA
jgi:hypothetical protein